MGRSATAAASLGIRILLSDLVLQIDETNFGLIKEMLCSGCIDDSNDYYNEAYKNIVKYDDKVPETYLEFKEYMVGKFRNNGSYYKSKFDNNVRIDLSHGCLLERHLLVPVKDILETERWGYDRTGTNSASRALDFDLSMDLDKYKEIKYFETVFIVSQHAG
jgi:hypothetical protein